MRLALSFASAFIAISAPVAAQATFRGAGETSDMDCDGGTATIEGAGNTMIITGKCTRLVIEGASNRVRVSLAPKGVIQITGAANTVMWTTPDGSKAQVRVTGAGNRISQGR